MNKLKKIFLKARGKIISIMAMAYIVLAYHNTAYATTTDIQNSIYVTGTKRLARDFLLAVQIVAVFVVAALEGFWALQKKLNPEQEEAGYTKRQKYAIITLIFIETIGTALGLFLGYYGISVDL